MEGDRCFYSFSGLLVTPIYLIRKHFSSGPGLARPMLRIPCCRGWPGTSPSWHPNSSGGAREFSAALTGGEREKPVEVDGKFAAVGPPREAVTPKKFSRGRAASQFQSSDSVSQMHEVRCLVPFLPVRWPELGGSHWTRRPRHFPQAARSVLLRKSGSPAQC